MFNELSPTFERQFLRDVVDGLTAIPKRLSPKYFYDSAGSELFEQICAQPEYYPTRTEEAILQSHAQEIAETCADRGSVVIELGSGSSSKTRVLLSAIQSRTTRACYFPIDISHSAMISSTRELSEEFPRMKVVGLVAEYLDGITRALELCVDERMSARNLITFLGSSIGNFEPNEAAAFLSTISNKMKVGDMMLIGFDLQKSDKELNAAYNDAAGITAKFNLNLLHRINRELGGRFDPGLFTHHAFYDRRKRRIEMHLVSARDQTVDIKATGRKFYFATGESIHTENSYKYTVSQVNSLARRCGLKMRKHFTDDKKWFDLALLERAD